MGSGHQVSHEPDAPAFHQACCSRVRPVATVLHPLCSFLAIKCGSWSQAQVGWDLTSPSQKFCKALGVVMLWCPVRWLSIVTVAEKRGRAWKTEGCRRGDAHLLKGLSGWVQHRVWPAGLLLNLRDAHLPDRDPEAQPAPGHRARGQQPGWDPGLTNPVLSAAREAALPSPHS